MLRRLCNRSTIRAATAIANTTGATGATGIIAITEGGGQAIITGTPPEGGTATGIGRMAGIHAVASSSDPSGGARK
jgi:hypothetical protein